MHNIASIAEFAALLSFALVWPLALLMVRFADKLPADHPNQRSLHKHPVPRTGGIAVMFGVVLAGGWFGGELLGGILLVAVMLSAFSIIDDIRGLSAFLRLLVHLGAAIVFVAWYSPDAFPLSGALASVLAIAWMTNLFNFMDGSDGLAGGMGLFGFGAYGVAAWLVGDTAVATLGFVIAASSLAFLCFNFHPARIFMGDGGSIPLGFMAAALGLWGYWRGLWPIVFPMLVFSPFILDATVTLLRRLIRGEKVWQAHKTHYYQRLVQMGLGHRNTALVEYGLMGACAFSAVWIARNPEWQPALLLAWIVVYVALMRIIDRHWSSHVAGTARQSNRQVE